MPWWLTTGYPGLCYFKTEFMMLQLTSSQASPGPFLTLRMRILGGSREGLIVFGLYMMGCIWELWCFVCSKVGNRVFLPLSLILTSLFRPHIHRSDMICWWGMLDTKIKYYRNIKGEISSVWWWHYLKKPYGELLPVLAILWSPSDNSKPPIQQQDFHKVTLNVADRHCVVVYQTDL